MVSGTVREGDAAMNAPIRSSLMRHVVSEATPEELFELRKRAWHEQGILVFGTSDLKGPLEQALALGVGNRLYGKRK